VPAGIVQRGWICYCAGAGGDITFEEALARQFGATVVCLDPLPASRRHVEGRAVPGLRFLPVALWSDDTKLRFYRSALHPETGSASAFELAHVSQADAFEVEARSLTSLTGELRHDHIDLLKLDIEGAEYAVVRPEELVALGVRVLALEFHAAVPIRRATRLVGELRRAGFEPVDRERTDVTFLRS
jgi:FkbM family methyltransferase